ARRLDRDRDGRPKRTARWGDDSVDDQERGPHAAGSPDGADQRAWRRRRPAGPARQYRRGHRQRPDADRSGDRVVGWWGRPDDHHDDHDDRHHDCSTDDGHHHYQPTCPDLLGLPVVTGRRLGHLPVPRSRPGHRHGQLGDNTRTHTVDIMLRSDHFEIRHLWYFG